MLYRKGPKSLAREVQGVGMDTKWRINKTFPTR